MIEIFDPIKIYCDIRNDVFGSIKDGKLMYSYTDHISDYVAGLIGQDINELIIKR